jgi:hypothetical protein
MEVVTPHHAKAVPGQVVLQQYLLVAMSMMRPVLRLRFVLHRRFALRVFEL